MSFAEIATRRRLGSVVDHLGELTWDVEPDGYQRVDATGADVDIILRLLLRRGLQPALVTMLLGRFEHRPLERALIAWDVAAGSLLGPDDAELAERLRADLVPLAQLGATASVAIPRDRVGALIEAVVAAGERPMSEGSEPQPSLASVAADTRDVDVVLAFAERLSLAQLPSLALAFTQILWHRRALPAALDRIVDTALDFERFDSMPILNGQDDRSLQLQTYFGMRACLAQLDTNSAASVLAQMSAYPAVVGSSDPGLVAARAELELLSDKPVGQSKVDAVSEVAPFGSTWRYGSRVRDELRIEVAPADAAITVEGFISSFGNDMRIWAQAGYHDDARTKLLALVSREIRYQSHDPNAWRALAIFAEDGSPIELELQERSMTQLVAALSPTN